MNESIATFFKQRKALIFFIITAIIGLLLVFSSSNKNTAVTLENNAPYSNSEYISELENKLEMLINEISGVSNVKVMITLESGNEYVYASDDTELTQKHVIVDDGLVCVTEKFPKIKGVAIVCNGGENITIKTKITELVCSVLGIYSSNVYVTE